MYISSINWEKSNLLLDNLPKNQAETYANAYHTNYLVFFLHDNIALRIILSSGNQVVSVLCWFIKISLFISNLLHQYNFVTTDPLCYYLIYCYHIKLSANIYCHKKMQERNGKNSDAKLYYGFIYLV